jgi:hypothetical protein
MDKKEISAEIERVEKQLLELREKLNQPEHKKPSEAKIGDSLEDGSIVVETYKNAVLVMAPKEADFSGRYEDGWESAFVKLDSLGFTLTDWFAPTAKIMSLAVKNLPQAFVPYDCYWTTSNPDDYEDLQLTVCSGFPQGKVWCRAEGPDHRAKGLASHRLFRFIAF